MSRIARFVITFILLVLVRLPVHAQSSVTDGVVIQADTMFRDLEKRIVRLEGNVQVVFQGQHLTCQRAEIDLRRQQITAEGTVMLTSPKAHIEGDRVVFNYKKNTGFIYNGFVQSGQVVFEGDTIEKMDEDRYLATNARYTACETCPPGWSFSGRVIDAEIGGYARIRRPVFRIVGVPVLILPSIIVPLKSSRQSGFLVPSMDYSRKGGLALAESYFLAIDRSQDLTLTGKWYEFRGYKAHGDYRYVLSEDSRGRLQSAWIQDRAIRKESNVGPEFDRWFTTYSHHHDLPNGYVHRADLNVVSDLSYPRDFPDEMAGHGEPALRNRTSISKTGGDQYFSAEVEYYNNLLKSQPLSRNDDAVHRFPEIRYSLKERPIGAFGPHFSLDLDYVNFSRERYHYDDLKVSSINGADVLTPIGLGGRDDVVRDGRYDPTTDIFRTGQRIDLRPTLSYPFQVARMFDVLPSISLRETQYRFYPTDSAEFPTDPNQPGFSPTAARRYLQFDLRSKTEFSRVFGGFTEKKEETRWKHSVEPEVGYSNLPWIRRPNHPFFGEFNGQQYSRQFEPLSDSDAINPNAKLQFDYHDRTYEKQVVDFVLNNRLTRKKWVNGSPDYMTVALFRMWQSYDFKEARSPTPHPWSSINGLLDVRTDLLETNTAAAYNPYAKVTNVSSRVKLKATERNYLQVTYNRSYILTDEYRVATNGETRNMGFGAGFLTKYIELAGQVDFNALTWEVQSWNYLLNLRPPGRCWLIRLEHRQIVGADNPQIRGSLSFEFGGEGRGSVF